MAALRAGIERDYPDHVGALDSVHREMAYFGDLTNALLESRGQRYDESLDIGDRRNALNSLRAIPARKRFGIRQYDRLPGKSALREFLADLAAPSLGALGLSMPLISSISKDCAEYFKGQSDYAEKVRDRVRARLCQLFERGDQIMLITHGLGCVASYDVLWELSHEPQYAEQFGASKVDAWLTLGAPLGDTNIRKRLLGAKEKRAGRFPTNVISWHNVAAEDDYTCHDNTLAERCDRILALDVGKLVNDSLAAA